MAALTSSLYFSALGHYSSERKASVPFTRSFASNFDSFRLRTNFSCKYFSVRTSNSTSRMVIRSVSTAAMLEGHNFCGSNGLKLSKRCRFGGKTCQNDIVLTVLNHLNYKNYMPTVSETKLNFLMAYKRPIPSIYNTAAGADCPAASDETEWLYFFVHYRNDAKKLEEWARAQNASSLINFSSSEGEVEGLLKDIAARARGEGSFSYSRFFAIGLFRLLELANASEPTILEQLCATLNINKRSVDRDLDVYRNLLSKLVQAKELLKEYVDSTVLAFKEKKKMAEREQSQKANEAVTKCLADYQYAGSLRQKLILWSQLKTPLPIKHQSHNFLFILR
ncbi:hypothetical protein ACSBR1_028114 [Camellia fascicularis]